MPKLFAYTFRVNAALAELGVSSLVVDRTYRSTMQQVGRNSGNSPEEVALFITSQLPVVHRASVNVAVIKEWVRAKEINPKLPEMQDALTVFALWELM
jgi:hypothetical protein